MLYDYLEVIPVRGVVVVGSPGIGKSLFNLYALARRLADGKVTVFTASPKVSGQGAGASYVFDNEDLVWCLHDSTAPAIQPALTFQKTFLAFAASPGSRFDGWISLGITFWHMDPWEPEELCDYFEKHQEKFSQDVYDVSGPCIRDYIRCCNPYTREAFEAHLREALLGLDMKAVVQLSHIVSDKEIPLQATRYSHRVFVCYKQEDTVQRCFIRIKSPWIWDLFLARQTRLQLDEAKVMFLACDRSGAMGAFAFESLGIRILSGQAPDTNLVGQFMQLKLDPNSPRKYISPSSSAYAFCITKRDVVEYVNIDQISFDNEKFFPRS
ncbi:hypothetical protein VKT23_012626 [Stygiomarasmius scandens]|uniref:Uncharacterized protein n=1 Tax=Marasmiellus scandens TaxID=2682957 RepID=A0ABR1J8C1_9AGAR